MKDKKRSACSVAAAAVGIIMMAFGVYRGRWLRFFQKLSEYVWSVSELDKKKKFSSETKRNSFGAFWALITNSFVFGFTQGKIYTGKLKNLCLPGLNCYSCPGAVASCPIGSLQAVIGSRNFRFSFYVVGFLVFIGAIFGRFVCGWLCPFGLFQDLLHKIHQSFLSLCPGKHSPRNARPETTHFAKATYGLLSVVNKIIIVF